MLPLVTIGKSFVITVTNRDILLAHAQHRVFKNSNSSNLNTPHALIKIVKCNQGPVAPGMAKHNSNTTTPLKSKGEFSLKESSMTEATGAIHQTKTNKSHGQ